MFHRTRMKLPAAGPRSVPARFAPLTPLAAMMALGLLLPLIGGLPRLAEGSSRRGHGRAAPIEWSATSPRVNLTHIFQGGVNRRDKPVGFHSRPGGRDPAEARVVRVLRPPNRFGVYEALVEIAPPAGSADERWLVKRSTFYPDRLDRAAVLAAILNAFQHREAGGGAGGDGGAGADYRFRGPSGLGFTVEGYLLDDGSVNTAYPIY
jgi:hypothetical protein